MQAADEVRYGQRMLPVSIWRDPLWFWDEPEIPWVQRWRLRLLKRDVRVGGVVK